MYTMGANVDIGKLENWTRKIHVEVPLWIRITLVSEILCQTIGANLVLMVLFY